MMGVGEMSKENGGPAFPTVYANLEGHYGTTGLSLRDYFAAKAMQSLVSAFLGDQLKVIANIESTAYQIADAMLDERAKLSPSTYPAQ